MTRLRCRHAVTVVVRLITAETMSLPDASARRIAASVRIPRSTPTAIVSLAVYGPSAPVRRSVIASAGLRLTGYPFRVNTVRLDAWAFGCGAIRALGGGPSDRVSR